MLVKSTVTLTAAAVAKKILLAIPERRCACLSAIKVYYLLYENCSGSLLHLPVDCTVDFQNHVVWWLCGLIC